MTDEVAANNYIEFRGHKGQRIAIGPYASFMIWEITEEVPASVGNDKITSGCFVHIGHLPPFIALDFYTNVLLKVGQVGRVTEGFEKVLKESCDSSHQDHKPTTASLAE